MSATEWIDKAILELQAARVAVADDKLDHALDHIRVAKDRCHLAHALIDETIGARRDLLAIMSPSRAPPRSTAS